MGPSSAISIDKEVSTLLFSYVEWDGDLDRCRGVCTYRSGAGELDIGKPGGGCNQIVGRVGAPSKGIGGEIERQAAKRKIEDERQLTRRRGAQKLGQSQTELT